MVKKDSISILETAILEMGRLKGEKSFSPSEVIQWIFPQSWEHFIPEVMDEMMRLLEEGRVSLSQEEGSVPKYFLPQTLFRIKT
ncbi:hypothetical protein P872_20100 [Rhodonellum psychrophilum GCM71 = DSM 17998]|uniref:Uncharacterized protein n=2 Tax=Rhodonellum TaxID=336827 RepID=U5BY70_9BACT|nr:MULTISPECIES: DUF3253 domain-containing protein [Rhodonellum]ERM81591.1 hypothetical protein P872_20100 [Rhodonellum psychrophilum GCM71 = DSM 17998]SDZ37037.1 Protein of unknown function [Rhodonellum ikkaensis]